MVTTSDVNVVVNYPFADCCPTVTMQSEHQVGSAITRLTAEQDWSWWKTSRLVKHRADYFEEN